MLFKLYRFQDTCFLIFFRNWCIFLSSCLWVPISVCLKDIESVFFFNYALLLIDVLWLCSLFSFVINDRSLFSWMLNSLSPTYFRFHPLVYNFVLRLNVIYMLYLVVFVTVLTNPVSMLWTLKHFELYLPHDF